MDVANKSGTSREHLSGFRFASSGLRWLQEGQKVTFVAAKGPKGMQADQVQVA